MSISTGLTRITVREAGKDTTKDWLSNNPGINDLTLPGKTVFSYLDTRNSFAYPIDTVVRAFSATPTQEFFDRQLSVTIVPTMKGHETLEDRSDPKLSREIARKAHFYTTILNGLPFLVSEDEDFLRFPLGDNPHGKAMLISSSLIKTSTSALLESIRGLVMLDEGAMLPSPSSTLNRLFFNSYAQNIIKAYNWQGAALPPDHPEVYEIFHGAHDSRYVRNMGLVPLDGTRYGLTLNPASHSILWHSTSRFPWEDAHKTPVQNLSLTGRGSRKI